MVFLLSLLLLLIETVLPSSERNLRSSLTGRRREKSGVFAQGGSVRSEQATPINHGALKRAERRKKEGRRRETHVAALLGTNSAAAALLAAITVPPGVCAPDPPSPTGGPRDTPPGTKTAAEAAEATEKGVEEGLL
jgi:hypothetical protein